MTAVAAAPATTKAPAKPKMARPKPQPSQNLPYEEFRQLDQEHYDWVINGMPCLNCGVNLVRGYDGRQDRSFTHMFEDGRSPDSRCNPELYR